MDRVFYRPEQICRQDKGLLCAHDEQKDRLLVSDSVQERIDQELLFVADDGLHIGITELGDWFRMFYLGHNN